MEEWRYTAHCGVTRYTEGNEKIHRRMLIAVCWV